MVIRTSVSPPIPRWFISKEVLPVNAYISTTSLTNIWQLIKHNCFFPQWQYLLRHSVHSLIIGIKIIYMIFSPFFPVVFISFSNLFNNAKLHVLNWVSWKVEMKTSSFFKYFVSNIIDMFRHPSSELSVSSSNIFLIEIIFVTLNYV